jgi:cold shock CspA family protein
VRGVVTAFDPAVGLGTVRTDVGEEHRFHCVEIADGTRHIDVGTAVEFEVRAKLGEREAACLRPI